MYVYVHLSYMYIHSVCANLKCQVQYCKMSCYGYTIQSHFSSTIFHLVSLDLFSQNHFLDYFQNTITMKPRKGRSYRLLQLPECLLRLVLQWVESCSLWKKYRIIFLIRSCGGLSLRL